MDLNWLHSLFYGFLSGLAEALPISAEAHQVLLLKFLGIKGDLNLMNLMIHLSVFGALYYTSQTQLIRMRRARALARVPKKKRKRPLDTRSMMDWSLFKTMLVPAILGVYLYQYALDLRQKLFWVAFFLFVNGVILYVPQYLPGSNKDSRTLSRVEALLMGLGGTASVLPGISSVGTAISIGSVCGVEREFCLSMALMMNMALTAGLAIYDVLALVSGGLGALSFAIIVRYLLSAAAAFGGTMLGVRVMRYLSKEHGYSVFGIYCWGMALFTFILNLMA